MQINEKQMRGSVEYHFLDTHAWILQMIAAWFLAQRTVLTWSSILRFPSVGFVERNHAWINSLRFQTVFGGRFTPVAIIYATTLSPSDFLQTTPGDFRELGGTFSELEGDNGGGEELSTS